MKRREFVAFLVPLPSHGLAPHGRSERERYIVSASLQLHEKCRGHGTGCSSPL